MDVLTMRLINISYIVKKSTNIFIEVLALFHFLKEKTIKNSSMGVS